MPVYVIRLKIVASQSVTVAAAVLLKELPKNLPNVLAHVPKVLAHVPNVPLIVVAKESVSLFAVRLIWKNLPIFLIQRTQQHVAETDQSFTELQRTKDVKTYRRLI